MDCWDLQESMVLYALQVERSGLAVDLLYARRDAQRRLSCMSSHMALWGRFGASGVLSSGPS
jgi:hypothetical protein